MEHGTAEMTHHDPLGYYSIIGVPPGPVTTLAHIQNSFRRIAIKANPGVYPPGSSEHKAAQQHYELLLAAYRVLRNSKHGLFYFQVNSTTTAPRSAEEVV